VSIYVLYMLCTCKLFIYCSYVVNISWGPHARSGNRMCKPREIKLLLTYLLTYVLTYLRTYVLTYLLTYLLAFFQTLVKSPRNCRNLCRFLLNGGFPCWSCLSYMSSTLLPLSRSWSIKICRRNLDTMCEKNGFQVVLYLLWSRKYKDIMCKIRVPLGCCVCCECDRWLERFSLKMSLFMVQIIFCTCQFASCM
jgi:hypothetical protein